MATVSEASGTTFSVLVTVVACTPTVAAVVSLLPVLTLWEISAPEMLPASTLIAPELAMRLVIPSGTAILLAFHIGYGAFFLSVLEIRSGRLDD